MQRAAIIGAGCSGITTIKNLLDAGIQEVVCFEQNYEIGGNWLFSPEKSHSSVCETTHIISSKEMSQYEDFPMPESYPDYPSHEQILQYFKDYVAKFDLRKYIRFNTTVERAVLLENGEWDVYTQGKAEAERFQYLLVSNGHHSVPRHYEIPGNFTGEYLHSHEFKNNSAFKDKKVVVIGAGNSACDCAVECSRVAEDVHISIRTPQYIVPKFIMGKPTDTFNKVTQYIPEAIAGWVRRKSLELQIGKYENYGLRSPEFSITKDHPTVNSELLYFLRHGKIKAKPEISKVQGKRIEFADGSHTEADVLIAATGYKIATPFFDKDFLDYSEADRIELYLRMFHPEHPSLIFIGLVQPQGAIWPLSEQQAKLAARYILGKWKWPSRIKALAKAETDKIYNDFLPKKRHTVEVHYLPYLKSLKKEINL
jgi:thioredoxin reductase